MIVNAYCFNPCHTPSFIQLSRYLHANGWVNVHERMGADLSNYHFECPDLIHLEYKHLLADFCEKHLPDLIPWSVYLDDDNWSEKLATLPAKGPWILKPSMLNNGQHIHVFEDTSDVIDHYQQNQRMGGPHVLQRYIQFPHLLKGPEKGHKYSIRMFMVMMPDKAFLYPQGYFNIALKPYDAYDFSSLKPHLTNEHLSHDTYNVVQIPTQQYPLFEPFFPQIQHICSKLAYGFYKDFLLPETFKLALFGIDFMVSADEKVWLLEVNHGPCFPTNPEHPLYQSLYHEFWQHLVVELLSGSKRPKRFVCL